MSFGFGEIALLVVVVFIIFGAGKLPGAMGDIGKSLRHFKDGLKGEEAKPEEKKIEEKKEK